MASSAGSFTTLDRISRPPNSGASVVPSEFSACARVSRLELVFSGPSSATYGLAATCSTVMPVASTNSAPRNAGYRCRLAAGQKPSAPTPAIASPATMPFL